MQEQHYGQLIAQWIAEAGTDQSALARKMVISPSAVNKQITLPDIKVATLAKYAKALGKEGEFVFWPVGPRPVLMPLTVERENEILPEAL